MMMMMMMMMIIIKIVIIIVINNRNYNSPLQTSLIQGLRGRVKSPNMTVVPNAGYRCIFPECFRQVVVCGLLAGAW